MHAVSSLNNTTTPEVLTLAASSEFDARKNSSNKVSREAAEVEIHIPLLTKNCYQRRATEFFIAEVFAKQHGAKLQYFLPKLFAINSINAQPIAAVGFQAIDKSPVFLEQYFQQPIDSILGDAIGENVAREKIAEVGNLACTSAGASRALIAMLSFYLHEIKIDWAVFTGTAAVVSILQKIGIEALPLAPANPDCLGKEQSNWGRYYQHNPIVMAVHIPHAQEVSAGYFQYLGAK